MSYLHQHLKHLNMQTLFLTGICMCVCVFTFMQQLQQKKNNISHNAFHPLHWWINVAFIMAANGLQLSHMAANFN